MGVILGGILATGPDSSAAGLSPGKQAIFVRAYRANMNDLDELRGASAGFRAQGSRKQCVETLSTGDSSVEERSPAERANPSSFSTAHGKQVPIFLARIIAYDGNLKERAGPTVNIAILALKGDKESERMSDDLFQAFRPLELLSLSGLPLEVSRVSFFGEGALEQTIHEDGIDTIYVCSGLDGSLAAIKRVAHKLRVLTIGSDEDQVKLGLSLGVFEMDGKNSIIVNLDASREEGVTFGPELFRLATVIR